MELRRLSRIIKGLTTRYSELALARIAKGDGLSRTQHPSRRNADLAAEIKRAWSIAYRCLNDGPTGPAIAALPRSREQTVGARVFRIVTAIIHAWSQEVMRAAKESKRSKRSRFLRDAMVDVQIASRGIRNKRVLLAMRQVPRELFLDWRFAVAAYEDSAVPIPKGQTISQPYIVARMLEAAAIAKSDRVLEIGAGSGYLAALAAKLGRKVCAIERHEPLVQRARSRLRHLGCRNVDLRQGDGTAGWPDGGEFEVILVSAASAQIPAALTMQLAPSGRLIIPLGDPNGVQWLTKLTRGPDGRFIEEEIEEVRFVPLVSG